MKRLIILLFFVLLITKAYSQQINGVIVSEDEQFKVVKVWGTHEERGYAVGSLLAAETNDLYINYLLPSFGSYYTAARDMLTTADHLKIDSVYIYEAMAMADGLNDSGEFDDEIDYIDVLLANCFLDFQNFVGKGLDMENGCSTLISWGSATENTELDGKSVLSRHLDWSTQQAILRTQVMVIHFPAEENEQPWLFIGFAGQMSVLSGINSSGVGVMQHMLSDVSSVISSGYEPIWFSLRKAIEINDYNSDGANNCLDINAVISDNVNGYADSYIVTGVAPATNIDNDKIATIIEVALVNPFITIRNTDYEDDIPDKNLYAANSSIARNDALNYCTRYNAVKANMGDGTLIGKTENWNIMLNYSSSCAFSWTGNIQFMQFAPEDNFLKLAYHTIEGVQACENTPVIYNTQELFEMPLVIEQSKSKLKIKVYPNPAKEELSVYIPGIGEGDVMLIYNSSGQIISKSVVSSGNSSLDISGYKPGIYLIKLEESGMQVNFIVQ
jgi:hypothetical protein